MDLVHDLVHNNPNMEVNIHEAKTNLSKLIQRVVAGEEITIAKAGIPVAKLIAVPGDKSRRKLGIGRGKIYIADDFNAPLPDDLLAAFHGEEPKKKRRRDKR